jgi:hypothetical protein
MRTTLKLIPMAGLSLMLAACGTTVTERAATGGLAGAAVGAAVSDSKTKGALIGGAVGAAAGAATTPRD